MKNVKLIITDLDFTVLHTDKSISMYTQDVFRKCKDYGILTAIATARYFIGAEKYIDILKPDYEITTDGTMIYNKGKFMYGYGFDNITTNNIIREIVKQNPGCELTVATDNGVYWNSQHISESPILYKARYNDYSNLLSECAYKIVAELPDQNIAESIAEKFDSRIIIYRGEGRYGFINKNVGKVQAIMNLSKILKISMADIMAFGDDMNDMEMLEQCGYGVAVANAINDVRKKAKFLTESNDEDGVAKFIDKNVFPHILS